MLYILSFTSLGISAIAIQKEFKKDPISDPLIFKKEYVEVKVDEVSIKRDGPNLKVEIYAHGSCDGEKIVLFSNNHNLDEIVHKYDTFEVGDSLIVKVAPKKFKKGRKGEYYHYSYIRIDELKVIKVSNPTIKDRIKRYRKRYVKKIESLLDSEQASAILSAITIGDKSGLDREIRHSFSSSGASHILAVSGLHVGYIYAFLAGILSLLGQHSASRIIRSITIIVSLWSYAIITGCSPSIVRAVTMGTIFEISSLIQRDRSSLNSLFVSALIITIFDPEAIFDIGFQLSYAAVLSIIYINPILQKIYTAKNRIVKYFWTIITISLSCQIGTSIIIIYYFNSFPIYFLLTNMIVLPLTAAIIYCTIAVFLTLEIPFLLNLSLPILEWLLKILIEIIKSVESMPHSTIHF